jgi:hypothetical protein
VAPERKSRTENKPTSPGEVVHPTTEIYAKLTPFWSYIRDTIIVNSDLSTEISSEIEYRKIKPGSTLLLMARSIKHARNYVLKLEGFSLILLAECYDSNGGAVDTSGSPGKDGADGAHGENRAIGANIRTGGQGGDGKAGNPGNPASPLTLVAAEITEARLIARGGVGGKGGSGGAGGVGAPGHPGLPGKFAAIESGKCGNGGNGADGGNGGSGAQIVVRYVNVHKPLQLTATGGVGGHPGSAGPGGKASIIDLEGGFVASQKSGEPGQPGEKMGQAGPDVAPIQNHFSKEEQWWGYVRQALGPLNEIWAKYRTRVGEYFFRNYQPSSDSKFSWFAAAGALHEFEAAMRLWNQADQARLFRQYINLHQSPIGVPYNYFLVPDFPRFEKVVTDYGPMVQTLFNLASELLLNAGDVANNRGRLSGELANAQNLTSALDFDEKAAATGVSELTLERQAADKRIEANEAKLDAVHQKMEEEQMKLEGSIITYTVAEVAGAIVSIVAAFYTGGATLAAAAACIGLLTQIPGGTGQGVSEDPVENFKQDTSGWVDWGAAGGPKLTPQANQFVGKLEDLIKKGKDFYDKFQMVEQLYKAKVDGELQNQEKELLIENLDLTMARNIVELKALQGDLQLAAAKQRKTAAEADIQNLKEQVKTVGANIALLADITRTLIRHTQCYADILTKYRFFAARAVDLWTSETEWSKSFSFAYGYLNPDVEENAALAASRGDPSRMLGLLQDYLGSWATLPELIRIRDDYEEHLSRLQPHRTFISVTDHKRISFFQNAGTLSVSVGIAADQLAPKTQSVYVALVGAKSQFPTVEINVEHPGQPRVSPPATQPIQCTFDKANLRPIATDVPFHLFGRNPTAIWRLSLDPGSAAKVDLSGLTEILLTIDYRSIPA